MLYSASLPPHSMPAPYMPRPHPLPASYMPGQLWPEKRHPQPWKGLGMTLWSKLAQPHLGPWSSVTPSSGPLAETWYLIPVRYPPCERRRVLLPCLLVFTQYLLTTTLSNTLCCSGLYYKVRQQSREDRSLARTSHRARPTPGSRELIPSGPGQDEGWAWLQSKTTEHPRRHEVGNVILLA